MNEAHRPASPLQLEGRTLLEMKASGHVSVSVADEGLQIQAPFGNLVIPYSRIDKATQDATSGIKLDAAGARVWLLDIGHFPTRTAFFALLQERVAAHQTLPESRRLARPE